MFSCFQPAAVLPILLVAAAIAEPIRGRSSRRQLQLNPTMTGSEEGRRPISFSTGPDLTTTLYTAEGEFQLEAYAFVVNAQILQSSGAGGNVRYQSSYDYSRMQQQSGTLPARRSALSWVSVGRPTFVRMNVTGERSNRTSSSMFHASPSGHYVYIQMLTDVQRKQLATAATEKYGVEISPNQMLNLALTTFDCSLVLYDDDRDNEQTNDGYLVAGTVTDFSNFPLRMDFYAPFHTVERKLFEEKLRQSDGHPDWQMTCSMTAYGTRSDSQVLTVQPAEYGLGEKLFGPSKTEQDTVLVTRTQLNRLAAEVYQSTDVAGKYAMSRSAFSDELLRVIVGQVAVDDFTHVAVDAALSALSRYGFDYTSEMKAVDVKKSLSEILKVSEVQDQGSVLVKSAESSTSVFRISDIFDVGCLHDRKWEKGVRGGVDDQLRRLNECCRNDFRWTVDGSRVVPVSVRVARLSRSKLAKPLVFARSVIQSYVAPFYREFGMYTRHARPEPPSPFDRLTVRITDLETALNSTNRGL